MITVTDGKYQGRLTTGVEEGKIRLKSSVLRVYGMLSG